MPIRLTVLLVRSGREYFTEELLSEFWWCLFYTVDISSPRYDWCRLQSLIRGLQNLPKGVLWYAVDMLSANSNQISGSSPDIPDYNSPYLISVWYTSLAGILWSHRFSCTRTYNLQIVSLSGRSSISIFHRLAYPLLNSYRLRRFRKLAQRLWIPY